MDRIMNPFDLLELRAPIAQSLDKSDLASCVLVSKTWYTLFVPFLWESILLREYRNRPDDRSARAIWSSPKRDFVKEVTYNCIFESTHRQLCEMPSFSNLKILNIGSACNVRFLDQAAMLITRNPTITRLYIRNGSSDSETNAWDLASGLVHLEDLTMQYCQFTCDDVDALIITCGRLRSLFFEGVNFYSALLIVPDLPVFPIRTLEVDSCIWFEDSFLLFVSKCPDLERFYCIGVNESFWHSFSTLAASGTWPNLVSLVIINACISDEDLATILTSMPRIHTLDAGNTAFGEKSFAALRPCLKTIAMLDLRDCGNVTPAMTTEVRQSCPNMRKQDFMCSV
ncbi:hypothetical protein BG011_001427 [Mortierella polycephala]|uniref:F-box domain-containing protein n=1 Tax=Mortierella polycephala TaxID=41804 RepID=A0A9P6PKU9_9FUNG|nr:hypothetical protein BG011_001427 [Mortierella polycephala]